MFLTSFSEAFHMKDCLSHCLLNMFLSQLLIAHIAVQIHFGASVLCACISSTHQIMQCSFLWMSTALIACIDFRIRVAFTKTSSFHCKVHLHLKYHIPKASLWSTGKPSSCSRRSVIHIILPRIHWHFFGQVLWCLFLVHKRSNAVSVSYILRMNVSNLVCCLLIFFLKISTSHFPPFLKCVACIDKAD